FLLDYQQPPLFRGNVLPQMLKNNFICFSSTLVSRQVIDNIGLLDAETSPSDDYDFWLRIARPYRFDYLDQPLVKYLIGHSSLSRREDRVATVLSILDRFLHEPDGYASLPASLVRATFAEIHCNLALAQRDHSRYRALWSYFSALRNAPA